MKYCMNCGAELTEESKFCMNCGTKVVQPVSSVSHEATESFEEATETIETIEKTIEVRAPKSDEELVVASWNPPRPKESAKPKEQANPKHTAKATKTSKANRVEKGVKPEETVAENFEPVEDDKPSWKSLVVKNLWIFIKVLLIAVGSVFALVIIKDFLTGDGHQPDAPGNPQELPVQQPTHIDDKEPSTIAKPNHPVVQKEDEIIILGEEEESNDGFQSLDDMPLHEKAEYMEGLLERSEAELNRELSKGRAADQSKINELRKSIAEIRQALGELKQ